MTKIAVTMATTLRLLCVLVLSTSFYFSRNGDKSGKPPHNEVSYRDFCKDSCNKRQHKNLFECYEDGDIVCLAFLLRLRVNFFRIFLFGYKNNIFFSFYFAMQVELIFLFKCTPAAPIAIHSYGSVLSFSEKNG